MSPHLLSLALSLAFALYPLARAEFDGKLNHWETEHTQTGASGGTGRTEAHTEPESEESRHELLELYCRNPEAEICQDFLPASEWGAVNAEVEGEAMEATQRALSSRVNGLTRQSLKFALTDYKKQNFDDWLAYLVSFTGQVERVLHGRLGADFELQNVLENDIKPAQIAAIRSHSSLGAGARQTLINAVSSVQYVLPSDYLARISQMPNRQDFAKFYQATCGPTGLSDNAFFFDGGDARGGPGMVICPGTLVKSIAMRNRGVPLRNFLAFTMSHELGHKIDASKFGIYEALKSCLVETKQFMLADPKKLGEVTADYWAAETMARLRPGAAGDTTGLVKLALRELCRNKANDIHPEGDYRVGFMGGNARIFGRAGCGELTGAHKVCALEGTLVVGAGGARPGGGRSSEDQVKGGAPLTRGTPNAAFLDEAEGILGRVSAEGAYQFLRKLPEGLSKEAFEDMYNARYLLDPSILREAIYDGQESPLIREIARREIERRIASATTRALSRDYGMRPERALVLEHRLRRALSRGEDAEIARQLSGLMDSLTPAQIAQRLERFQVEQEALSRSKADPTRQALVKREIWAAHEALGKDKAEGEEDDFRKLFARSWADIKRADLEFRQILDEAVEGDAGSRARLFRRLDGELALDFMGVHLSPGGDTALAVKLARAYARRATDGTLYLDLRARQHGFDEANGKPRQTLRLGKEDHEIRAALEAFDRRSSHGEARFRVGGRLQRFTVAGAPGESGRSYWRTDGKDGLVEYSPLAVDRATAPRPATPPLPTKVSPARAAALFKSYCAGCHGPGGRAQRFLDGKGKLYPSTVNLDAMLRDLRRQDGSNFMPPLGSAESQSLSSDARDAMIRWVEQAK